MEKYLKIDEREPDGICVRKVNGLVVHRESSGVAQVVLPPEYPAYLQPQDSDREHQCPKSDNHQTDTPSFSKQTVKKEPEAKLRLKTSRHSEQDPCGGFFLLTRCPDCGTTECDCRDAYISHGNPGMKWSKRQRQSRESTFL